MTTFLIVLNTVVACLGGFMGGWWFRDWLNKRRAAKQPMMFMCEFKHALLPERMRQKCIPIIYKRKENT